ncbi:MAG: Hsp70 family protein [Sandaracinaceae bacterium]
MSMIEQVMHPTRYAIDFGTTNSLLAGANADDVFGPIPLDPRAADPTVLRSLLFFPDGKRLFLGAEAIHEYGQAGMRGRLIRSIKKHLPSRAFVGTRIEERPMNLEDLIGAFLSEMRRRADRHFGCEVKKVLLGRPALFSQTQEDDRFAQYRLERAAKIAGFEEIAFCPEPIAAAADYRRRITEPKLIFVADFGGGTSDFTVLRLRPDGYAKEDVLAIGGVSVAGDAYDGALMRRHVAKHFGAEVTYRVPMGRNILTMPTSLTTRLCSPADLSMLTSREARAWLRDVQRWSLGDDDQARLEQLFTVIEDGLGFVLFEAIEEAKRALSREESTTVRFTYPTIDVSEPVSRPQFQTSTAAATETILNTLDDTLARAGVSPAELDLVCQTGGTARVPAIADALRERFGESRIRPMGAFHSVIGGLAERARDLEREASR